ncbi:hypothetical protein K402DRAFT_256747 [Aulographum hederae CBS 113979]|uniref:Zn(2)-C6 fungal-type domain-containing protein n=1 Tax=Aulographum hederae CBS 113979 TaxID=1176131 RepID=A0A6G1H923_9PEZI|nr:hypothetical protein K402DRAFT_256747 [Aulographum hederae CBS 113979]
MTTVLALQPAMPRPSPVPIAAATHSQTQTQTQTKGAMLGKENIVQVRPISTTGATANIRTRRERPCDACRRRKSRCVIHEGAVLCVLCEFHKQDCTFVQSPQPRKRKLPSEPKKDDIKKRSTDPVPEVKKSVSAKPNGTPKQIAVQVSSGPNPPQFSGETLGLQRRKHSRYIGLTTPFDATLIGLSQFDTHNESNFDLGTLRRVNDHECFIMLPDETAQDFNEDAEALNAIENIVAPHGSALVDIYFRIIHPSFPIVQKRIFYERLRNGDRQFSPPLLAGMYILALNWWVHEPELAHLRKPDAAKLDVIASKSLSIAMQRPKLSTVQAGLLLLQRPEADSWSLTTQLVAIGQELGLHLDCSNWSVPQWEKGLRNRIAWGLYMQDKWSSLIHGRPSHIFSANWAVRAISDENFHENEDGSSNPEHEDENENEEAEKGQILFAQMISLTAIMAEIMDTFYTQVAIQDLANAGKNSTQLILERAKPVQIRLKEWFAKLPASARMDNVVANQLSATGYLHLAYFATEITLHRRIVQSLDPATSDAYLLYICRSAAKTRLISAMDFVNRLRPEHLQAFWYFPSKTNFTLIGTFGSLLWATAPAQEEAEFYKTRLREYRWTLSVSSKRAEFLDYAVQMLDASKAMLNNLAKKPSYVENQISKVGVPAQSVTSTQLPTQEHDQDALMGDAPPSLSRITSNSAFSGFSNETLDQYGSDQAGGTRSPSSPPTSVG